MKINLSKNENSYRIELLTENNEEEIFLNEFDFKSFDR